MTLLKMADGPVANLPQGMNAYAGYVNRSGIGITWPGVVALAAKRNAIAFSITTNGSPAQCADVEPGAMSSWLGYSWGYCSVARVNQLIAEFGRPQKLWTAHYTGTAHICSPACWPGLATTADGTQWIDHGGWDESLLRNDFFDLTPPKPTQGDPMLAVTPSGNGLWRCDAQGAITTYGDADYLGGPNTSQVNGKWGGPPVLPAGETCTAIASHPTTQGYWVEASDGDLYAYGAAQFMTPNR